MTTLTKKLDIYKRVSNSVNKITGGNNEWLNLLGIGSMIGTGALSLLYTTPILRHKLPRAMKIGTVLALADLAWENIGHYTKSWDSYHSLLKIGHAPVEVVAMSAIAGAVFSGMLPDEKSRLVQASFPLAISLTGASLEWWLRKKGYMKYHKKYKWFHAVITYFILFMGLHELHYKL